MMDEMVVAGAVRTHTGRSGGALASLEVVALGVLPVREAVIRSGCGVSTTDRVLLGQVLQAGADQNPVRQAAVAPGLGMESMSDAIHLLDRSWVGHLFGHGTLIDVLARDGPTCAFASRSMGEATARHQAALEVDG